MRLPSLYEPVAQELRQVAEALDSVPAEAGYPGLSRLLRHVLGHRGKMLRPALTLLTGKCYCYQPRLHIPMATAVELLHTATLIHDDSIDHAAVRRGQPTLNMLWDHGAAVLAGDYLFSLAARLAADTGNLEVIKLFAGTLMSICRGELEEKHASRDLGLSRERYFARIGDKTAALFSAATETGARLGEASPEAVGSLRDYGYNLGMAFQIVDDILDFVGDEEEMGKPVGWDLLQGTLTLPALLLLERYPQDNPIAQVFHNQRPEESLERAIQMIRGSSIIDDCYGIAGEFQARACRGLEGLGDSPFKTALQGIAHYSVSRRS